MDLRKFIDIAREAGELYDIRKTVDPVRELGAVLNACERAGKGALFHSVKGYDIPVTGALLSSQRRIALALGCEVSEVGARMAAATQNGRFLPCGSRRSKKALMWRQMFMLMPARSRP